MVATRRSAQRNNKAESPSPEEDESLDEQTVQTDRPTKKAKRTPKKPKAPTKGKSGKTPKKKADREKPSSKRPTRRAARKAVKRVAPRKQARQAAKKEKRRAPTSARSSARSTPESTPQKRPAPKSAPQPSKKKKATTSSTPQKRSDAKKPVRTGAARAAKTAGRQSLQKVLKATTSTTSEKKTKEKVKKTPKKKAKTEAQADEARKSKKRRRSSESANSSPDKPKLRSSKRLNRPTPPKARVIHTAPNGRTSGSTSEGEGSDESKSDARPKRTHKRPKLLGEEIARERLGNEASGKDKKRSKSSSKRAIVKRPASRKTADAVARRNRKSSRRSKEDRRPVMYNESDSDTCSTDEMMERKRRERLNRDRGRIRPVNMGLFDEEMAPEQEEDKKRREKKKNADISPMVVDLDVDWDSIGGLTGHIQKLKEMVVLPMLYPKEFSKFKMNPPKGVIFHGPPGTGKTLVARVLAAQCSRPGKKVAFYMRKGADCLSKWVGEAERQLRLLFDEAHKNQPAIIFFDEIDGLAPVRSSRQDQIHSSIVSTLLALMDGLDGRGQVIVIGATNRIDAIDPALRRPGRFDRELCFTLPSRAARKQILKIKTKTWSPPLPESLLETFAQKCVGYCGADLEALCREAFMCSVRRTFPQIYHSDVKLKIDPSKLVVTPDDFNTALLDIVPAAQRSAVVYAKALPKLLAPLLSEYLEALHGMQKSIFPLSCATKAERMNLEHEKTKAQTSSAEGKPPSEKEEPQFQKITVKPCRPRLLISAPAFGHGQSQLGVAVLHKLEEYPTYSLDLPSLFGDISCRNAEEACLRIFKEARKNAPSVIYWPHVQRWWEAAHLQLRLVIVSLLQDIPEDCPVFLLGTADSLRGDLPDLLQQIFNTNAKHYEIPLPKLESLRQYWQSLKEFAKMRPKRILQPKDYPKLEVASDAEQPLGRTPRKRGSEEEREEQAMAAKMDFNRVRCFVRTCCQRLVKHFKDFLEPREEEGVCCNNLTLLDVRDNNNRREFPTVDAFLEDIDQIVANVRGSYNPTFLAAREYMNEACHLQDQALALACQADRDLVLRVRTHIKRIKTERANATPKKPQESPKEPEDEGDQKEPLEPKPAKEEEKVTEPPIPPKRQTPLPATPTPEKTKPSQEMQIDEPATPAKKSPEPAKAEEDPDKDKVLVLDEKRLDSLLERAATASDANSLSIMDLEDSYYRMLNFLHYHSSSWDRTELLDSMDEEVRFLERQRVM